LNFGPSTDISVQL